MLSKNTEVLIFIVIYLAMISNSFWEAYVEGNRPWDKGKLGWKVKVHKYYFTAYHFYLFCVMWPLLLTLPFVIYGWNQKLLGVLISAYMSGLVLEDIAWYVVNPVVKFRNLNSKQATYYPWLKIGKFEAPVFYVIELLIAFLSWYLIWR